uniref:Uncharacterized protein n=1 Tax=Solanum tuberosum TaxID=4113 RepID=M1DZ40_SOLTU
MIGCLLSLPKVKLYLSDTWIFGVDRQGKSGFADQSVTHRSSLSIALFSSPFLPSGTVTLVRSAIHRYGTQFTQVFLISGTVYCKIRRYRRILAIR